ncbi:hypothetical protein D4A35_01805 [Paraclostridium bifermentans]|uniref:Uncharacterized protein n=1 Tax=Paraclostridium bifermentans TaxID=1490 RepID=A0A5P3X9S5_PARBF|nr:hypothetical protein [Paraclostridium bifermentans]QEZ67727.1 hypothetical protein D4A35_01805 [Paraclostridium bifermentans]
MGLIRVEELLKLDRFRDFKEGGRVIEKGIIDEIIRMVYNCNRLEFNEYNVAKSKNINFYGHYMVHNQIIKNHELDVFFKAVEKKVRKSNEFLIYDTQSQEEFEDTGRYYGFIALVELSAGKYNKSLSKFGISINSVDDFKEVLVNEEKMNKVMKVLYSVVTNMHRNNMRKMSNKGFYLDRYTDKEDGKRKYKLVRTDNTSLDTPLKNEEGDKVETLLDKYAEEKEFYEEHDKIEEGTNNILKYIHENKESILLKKQINTLSKFGEEGNYTGDKSGNANRQLIKKRMMNSLDNYIDKDRFLYRYNENINVRDYEFMKFFESIIMCNKRSEQFKIVVEAISKANKLSNTISNIILKLPISAYKPIFQNKLVYKYLNKEFLQVLYSLLDHYNFISEVKLEHFDLEDNNKIKFLIENYVMKEGVLVFSQNDYGLVTVTELRNLINSINKTEYKNIGECKSYLEELGYKVNTKNSTKRRSLSCYKIERL